MSETDQALEVKAKGNELFKQKKFQDAISLYEEALSLCPSDQTQHVAALHHNIAACLENMVLGGARGRGRYTHVHVYSYIGVIY